MKTKLCRTEFFRFACAGGVGFITDYLTLLLCVQTLMFSPYLSRLFSFMAAVITTYILNRTFTFSTRIMQGSRIPGFLSYTGTMILGLCLNYAVYAIILYVTFSMHLNLKLLLAVGSGSLAGMGLNFFFATLRYSKRIKIDRLLLNSNL